MWRTVETFSLEGKTGVGGNQRATVSVPVPGGRKALQGSLQGTPPRPAEEVQLPFMMELKRPGNNHSMLRPSRRGK